VEWQEGWAGDGKGVAMRKVDKPRDKVQASDRRCSDTLQQWLTTYTVYFMPFIFYLPFPWPAYAPKFLDHVHNITDLGQDFERTSADFLDFARQCIGHQVVV